MKIIFWFVVLIWCSSRSLAQSPVTGSFVATLGTDTVIVETYNLVANHLFGKAFVRYPRDQVRLFDFHFFPDGSIRHYSVSDMNPDSTDLLLAGTEGLWMENDTCTWFASYPPHQREYINKRPASKMDFVGGWTPTLSLIEWNCMRLLKSGRENLPLTLINDYIGIKQVGVSKGTGDTIIFGGDFLEYAKIKVSKEGKIISYDGTATPWNYIVNRFDPIDVDEVARRMSKKPKIGNPSPKVVSNFLIAGDTINVSYGSPFKRGRQIFGGVVPYDSIWRTGAGEPTAIRLKNDLQFGKVTVPRGSYSIYTIPRLDGWTLLFNTDLKRWPTEPDRSRDIASVPMQVRKAAQQTDQFKIMVEPAKGGGVLKFVWDETEASAAFKVAERKN